MVASAIRSIPALRACLKSIALANRDLRIVAKTNTTTLLVFESVCGVALMGITIAITRVQQQPWHNLILWRFILYVGWWRERPHLGKWQSRTRYSFVVSISTPEEQVNIYTPVANQIGITIPVAVMT